ncbi:MAG: hypothetical protein EHM58_05395 [Ignavibacteriae bacterium]|nr:MAG: hypothetical protein EHM58_05395 [Ignavibacteriota bacterium]
MENKSGNGLEPQDFTQLLKDYSNKWVVLSFDEKEVIKSGDAYDDIMDFTDKGIVMLVPDNSQTFFNHKIKCLKYHTQNQFYS